MANTYLLTISQVTGTLSNDQMSHFSIALALLLEELYTKSCKQVETSDHATILAKGSKCYFSKMKNKIFDPYAAQEMLT